MKRKRLWLTIASISIVSWLYITPLSIYSWVYGEHFYCEPLSTPLSEGEHYFRYTPSVDSNHLWDLIDSKYSPESNDEMYKHLDRETRAWTRGCDVARDNRKVFINIILVAFAVLFFWLPKDPPRRSKEESQIGDDPSKDGEASQDGETSRNGGDAPADGHPPQSDEGLTGDGRRPHAAP